MDHDTKAIWEAAMAAATLQVRLLGFTDADGKPSISIVQAIKSRNVLEALLERFDDHVLDNGQVPG